MAKIGITNQKLDAFGFLVGAAPFNPLHPFSLLYRGELEIEFSDKLNILIH